MSKAISSRRFGVMARAAAVFALCAMAAVFCAGCGGGDGNPSGPGTTPGTNPGGGGSYSGPIVTIGSQKWMGKNLDRATANSKCYANSADSCAKYGRLYTWSDAKTACPSGWHLPTDDEWQTLVDYAGGDTVAGGKLKSTSGWYNNGNGTNAFGFSALPGGLGGYSGGGFGNAGDIGIWWSATKNNTGGFWIRRMDYFNELVRRGINDGTGLLSVRCVAN